MSVRRLAEKQPSSFEFTPENKVWAEKEIAKYPPGRQASAVIALLWRAQKQNSYWLSRPAIEKVAEMLDMPKIRVLEVATFYTMFNLEPVGRHYVQLCGTTPCALAGADDIKAVLRKRVGEADHVSADGLFSWTEVECLGACCNAPMVQINDDYYEDLTAENFAKLLDDLAAGRPVKTGSQIGRVSSEPVGGLTSLTSLYGADGRAQPRAPAPANDEAGSQASAKAPSVGPPSVPPAGAGAGAGPGSADEAAAQAHAEAEEAHVKAALAKLPADATAEQKANAVGDRPAALATPRSGAPDDLKRIKGVGPVNEKNLHALGVFHFDQIAVWTLAEIRWVGTYLAFPGRIHRERWVAQADTLAKGGVGLKDQAQPARSDKKPEA
jgi:NADH-quinone oxidoreductase subunit E